MENKKLMELIFRFGKLQRLLLPVWLIMLPACHGGQMDKLFVKIISIILNNDSTGVKTTTSVVDEYTDLEIPAHNSDEIILKRIAYTVGYNQQNKTPNWVAWHLTAERTAGEQKRLSNFIEDEEVPYPRAELADYKGSGYDRGHMCPAGDNKWAFEPMRESFYLTNICPQDKNLNAGDWNELEITCREWANVYGSVYIVAGPIHYSEKGPTIGLNKVRVPDAFFKVVLRTNGDVKALGFVYPNKAGNNPPESYVCSVDDVERITGIDFFPSLPEKVASVAEAQSDLHSW